MKLYNKRNKEKKTMATKTLLLAAAAGLGLAASADVYEVKFTVKTDVNGKYASKTINGVVDTTAGEHTFWTTEGRTKVAIANSYFGFTNDKVLGRKIGQNAELIWGENDENVLVAGAWGTDKSKSGQAAGMLAKTPANGTWSAKLSKLTYAALLAKNGVEAADNRANSPLADVDQKIADANAAADEKVKDAERDAKAAIDATNEYAQVAIKAAQDDAQAKIDATNEYAQAAIKAAQDEADKAIEDANAKVAGVKAELDTIKGAFNTMADPTMTKEFNNYLDEKYTAATNLIDGSSNKLAAAYVAWTNYTDKLDPEFTARLEQDVLDATNAWIAATNAEVEAKKAYNAAIETNEVWKLAAASENPLVSVTNWFGEKIAYIVTNTSSGIDYAAGRVAYLTGLLSTGGATFINVTNTLTAVLYGGTTNNVTINAESSITGQVGKATATYQDALDLLAVSNGVAEAALAKIGNPDSIDTYGATVSDWSSKSATEQQDAYDAYLAGLVKAYDSATNDVALCQADADAKEQALKALVDEQEKNEALLKEAVDTGKAPDEQTEKNIAERQAQVDSGIAETNRLTDAMIYWANYPFVATELAGNVAASQNERVATWQAWTNATDEVSVAATAHEAAVMALTNAATTQSNALSGLGSAIGVTGLTADGAEGAYNAYVEKYEGYVTKGEEAKKAVEDVRAWLAEEAPAEEEAPVL